MRARVIRTSYDDFPADQGQIRVPHTQFDFTLGQEFDVYGIGVTDGDCTMFLIRTVNWSVGFEPAWTFELIGRSVHPLWQVAMWPDRLWPLLIAPPPVVESYERFGGLLDGEQPYKSEFWDWIDANPFDY
jgi:hypothetical protein